MNQAFHAEIPASYMAQEEVRAGGYRFIAASGEAYFNERPVRLTARELDLALYFFRRIGRPLARRDIALAVWGHDAGILSRTLDAHVSKLRRKLALRTANGFRLAGLYGVGYRLEPASRPPSS
jgi:DNA-binding response OmpR family regulator